MVLDGLYMISFNMDKHCTNCRHFAWWDGDYCCMFHMKILQESPDRYFTKEIPFNNCKNYKRISRVKYADKYELAYKEFLKTLKNQ